MDQKSIGDRLQQAWMNNLLIAVNVLVFAVGMAGTGRWRDPGSLYRAGALYAPLLLKGQGYYRLLTSIFLHADLSHLFNNMIVQFAGGEIVEKNLGHVRYGILYIVCGIGGNLVSVASDYFKGQYGYSVGSVRSDRRPPFYDPARSDEQKGSSARRFTGTDEESCHPGGADDRLSALQRLEQSCDQPGRPCRRHGHRICADDCTSAPR